VVKKGLGVLSESVSVIFGCALSGWLQPASAFSLGIDSEAFQKFFSTDVTEKNGLCIIGNSRRI